MEKNLYKLNFFDGKVSHALKRFFLKTMNYL